MGKRMLYAVVDVLSDEYGPIFEAHADEVARRSIWSLLRKVPKYDRDSFKLKCLGVFEDGEIKPAGYFVDVDLPKFDSLEKAGMLGFDEVENEPIRAR